MPRRAYNADASSARTCWLLAAAHDTSRATIAADLDIPAGALRELLRAT